MSFQLFQQRYDLLGCPLFTRSKPGLTDRNCIPLLWLWVTQLWLISIAPPSAASCRFYRPSKIQIWAIEQGLGWDEARCTNSSDACQSKANTTPNIPLFKAALSNAFILTVDPMTVCDGKALSVVTNPQRIIAQLCRCALASFSSLFWFYGRNFTVSVQSHQYCQASFQQQQATLLQQRSSDKDPVYNTCSAPNRELNF